jgi:hypothetical protein
MDGWVGGWNPRASSVRNLFHVEHPRRGGLARSTKRHPGNRLGLGGASISDSEPFGQPPTCSLHLLGRSPVTPPGRTVHR